MENKETALIAFSGPLDMDDPSSDFRRAALNLPTVARCVEMYERMEWSWQEALTRMALALSEDNQKLQALAIDLNNRKQLVFNLPVGLWWQESPVMWTTASQHYRSTLERVSDSRPGGTWAASIEALSEAAEVNWTREYYGLAVAKQQCSVWLALNEAER